MIKEKMKRHQEELQWRILFHGTGCWLRSAVPRGGAFKPSTDAFTIYRLVLETSIRNCTLLLTGV